jgi:hypothetical protein
VLNRREVARDNARSVNATDPCKFNFLALPNLLTTCALAFPLRLPLSKASYAADASFGNNLAVRKFIACQWNKMALTSL